MHGDHLSLALAVTIRHDGRGGIADDLATPPDLVRWLRAHARVLGEYGFPAVAPAAGGGAPSEVTPGAGEFVVDDRVLAAVVAVRTAIRALFARAVLPGEPSSADAGRLPDAGAALELLNAASARVPVAPRLTWPPDGTPVVTYGVPGAPEPAGLPGAALARAAISFLAGPDRSRLRACPAPRCVRYFVQAHARQEWCKPSCGNRARVARHHARRREQEAPGQEAPGRPASGRTALGPPASEPAAPGRTASGQA
jgi:predicted RNA-binding Zn ribbon-like protein